MIWSKKQKTDTLKTKLFWSHMRSQSRPFRGTSKRCLSILFHFTTSTTSNSKLRSFKKSRSRKLTKFRKSSKSWLRIRRCKAKSLLFVRTFSKLLPTTTKLSQGHYKTKGQKLTACYNKPLARFSRKTPTAKNRTWLLKTSTSKSLLICSISWMKASKKSKLTTNLSKSSIHNLLVWQISASN